MDELRASADLRGERVQLMLGLTGSAAPPRVQLVRRRFERSAAPTDGLMIVDVAELFPANDDPHAPAGAPWARVERRRYLITNAVSDGGMLQAEVALYTAFAADRPRLCEGHPRRVVVRVHHGEGLASWEIKDGDTGSNVVIVEELSGTLELSSVVNGNRIPRGRITLLDGRLRWAPADPAGTVEVDFDLVETQISTAEVDPRDPRHATITTTCGKRDIRIIDLQWSHHADSGEPIWMWTLLLDDSEPSAKGGDAATRGLTPGTTYYYAVFDVEPKGRGPATERPRLLFTSSATATQVHGFGDHLYGLLPAIHRHLDEPTVERTGEGQLRRFLHVFGAGLDLAHSLGEGLGRLHDVLEVNDAFLPYLASWIGWGSGHARGDVPRRSDILAAPEIFATGGTLPNLCALFRRMTGWQCEVKELADNVLLTNAVETVRLWQIYEATSTQNGVFLGPSPQADLYPAADEPAMTQAEPDAFDGRPAAVRALGVIWLFWHSHRRTRGLSRRRIWAQALARSPSQVDVLGDLPDDASFVDEDPAAVVDGDHIWLFWTSNRGGCLDLWARTLDVNTGKTDPPTRLTAHVEPDRRPAAVRDTSGRIWVFFASSRRGPTDIWAMSTSGKAISSDSTTWDRPIRISAGAPRDDSPAAVVDAGGNVRIFWGAEGQRGNQIKQAVRETNGSWTVSDVTKPARARFESPTAVLSGDNVLSVLWHSDSDGHFRLYRQTLQQMGTWSEPGAVFARISCDKEPAAIAEPVTGLRLFFRSQQGGERLRSRTFDAGTDARASRCGVPGDRAHYTYDTRRTKDALIARDTVAVYVTPDDPRKLDDNVRTIRRFHTFFARFRPLPVRIVWLLKNDGGFTPVDPDDDRKRRTQP